MNNSRKIVSFLHKKMVSLRKEKILLQEKMIVLHKAGIFLYKKILISRKKMLAWRRQTGNKGQEMCIGRTAEDVLATNVSDSSQ